MAKDPGAAAMMARAVLVVSLFALIGLAAAPTASAADDPCVVGSNAERCAVSVYWVVCVTEPCDPMKVCVGYGRVCNP